jgi:hypothetical protein
VEASAHKTSNTASVLVGFYDRSEYLGEVFYSMTIYSAPKIIRLTLLCAICAICGCADPKIAKTAEEQRFLKMLAADTRIEDISIEGDQEDFALYNVFTVSFSIRGKPNSRVILLPYGDPDLDALRILQIGNISPIMMEHDPTYGWVTPSSPTMGNDQKYRPPLPWKNMNLSMLVSHYDEVIEFFSKWPRSPDFETITTDGSVEVRCSIEPADASTMRRFTPPSSGSLHQGDLETRNSASRGTGDSHSMEEKNKQSKAGSNLKCDVAT